MWQRFLDTLAAWEARGIAAEETVSAARAAFRVAAAYLAPASD
jgi:heme oxygenase